MTGRHRLKIFRRTWLFLVVATALLGFAKADETNSITNAVPAAAPATVVSNEDSLRSSLQIQEQLHNTLLTIEKNRVEAERNQREAAETAARTAKIIEGKLTLMENGLVTRQDALEREMIKNADHSNRVILVAAGSFALMGFLVLLLSGYVQWMAVNRLAAVAAKLPGGSTQSPALAGTEVLPGKVLEQSTAKFLGAMEKLEQRVQAIETSGRPMAQLAESNSTSLAVAKQGGDMAAPIDGDEGIPASKSDAVNMLIGKGLTLLKLDKPAAAMDCFEEALALDPGHADAWVKKGAALERLQRLDEAIECYDLAIARDNSMTMAYLYKGGVFNRMERYSEALECYEQALKSKQKGQAANVIID